MRSKRMHVIITVLTVLVALVVVNYLASRHYARLDLTEKSLYTLSPATRSILSELDDVVTIRVYFSFDLPPALMALRRGVDDMLKEYRSAGGKNINIEYINPAADAVAERRALMLGIAPVQLNVIERDRHELVKVYMGMAVLHADRIEVLPVIQSTANLEYRLDQAIVTVSSAEKISLGWWGPGASERDNVGGGYGGITRLLGERYDLQRVDPEKLDGVDPKRFGTLVVASPGELGQDSLQALNSYLAGGGKIIALVDRWVISDKLTASPKKTDITSFLDKYGIVLGNDMVMDRSNAMASFAGQLVTYHLPYPFWPRVLPENLSRTDPMTAELGSLVLPWASSIDLADSIGEGGGEILAKSTAMAAATKGDMPRIDPETAGEELTRARGNDQYALAVRVRRDGAEIIAVGSGRFAQDNFVGRYPENAAFMENAVDALAMGDKLIGVRSRIGMERPLALLSGGVMLTLRVLNTLIGPLLVIVIAAAVFLARRWRKRSVRAAYGGQST